ncbi:MAG: T9SS type A sorting domain-containing protein [Nitrososphaerales archaeon]
MEVFNAIGKRIDVRLKLLDNGLEIDMMDQPNGIYFVKLRDENEYFFKNLIICRI